MATLASNETSTPNSPSGSSDVTLGGDDKSEDFLDDVLDDMLHDKRDGEILSFFFGELSDQNMFSKIFSKKYWKTAQVFSRLSHRTSIAYPLSKQLSSSIIRSPSNLLRLQSKAHLFQQSSGSNPISLQPSVSDTLLHEELKYALRHAVASYPGPFLVLTSGWLGEAQKEQKLSLGSVAFKSHSKLLRSYFGKDHTRVVVNKLSDFKHNKTHRPCYYVMAHDDAPVVPDWSQFDANAAEAAKKNIKINKKRLVIAIRGSNSINDFLTDVDGMCETIHILAQTFDKAAEAMKQFAENMARKVSDVISDLLSELERSTQPQRNDTIDMDQIDENYFDATKPAQSATNVTNETKDAKDSKASNESKTGKNGADGSKNTLKKDGVANTSFATRHGIKFLRGTCHSGMYRAARWLRDELEPILFNVDANDISDKTGRPRRIGLNPEWEDYDIVITGHSLGAGVASLLALLYYSDPIMYETFIKTGRLKCYGFACPPIVSREIAIDFPVGSGKKKSLDQMQTAPVSKFTPQGADNSSDANDANDAKEDAVLERVDSMDREGWEEYIYSVNLGTDAVSRMSLESIVHCNQRLDYLRKCEKKLVRKAIIDLEDFAGDDEEQSEQKKIGVMDRVVSERSGAFSMAKFSENVVKQTSVQDSDVSRFLKNLEGMKATAPQNLMYPAGRVLWMVPEAVFEEDVVERRRKMMNVNEKDQKKYEKSRVKDEKKQEKLQAKQAKEREAKEAKEAAQLAAAQEPTKSGNSASSAKSGWKAFKGKISKTAKSATSGKIGKSGKTEKSEKAVKTADDDEKGQQGQQVAQVQDNEQISKALGGKDEKNKWERFGKMFASSSGTKKKRKKVVVRDMDWILTDATMNKRQFQEYTFDYWESIFCHFPLRYMAALDPKLKLRRKRKEDVKVKKEWVDKMVEMGYDKEVAIDALASTENKSLNAAIEYVSQDA